MECTFLRSGNWSIKHFVIALEISDKWYITGWVYFKNKEKDLTIYNLISSQVSAHGEELTLDIKLFKNA